MGFITDKSISRLKSIYGQARIDAEANTDEQALNVKLECLALNREGASGKTIMEELLERYKETEERDMTYVKCFYGSDYWSEIDVIDVTDPANFMMILRTGMRVTFGPVDTIEALERKIKMLDAIIPQVKQTERSYLDLTTDKGYFGTYTEDEYENIKKLREDGELIKKLTGEEAEDSENPDEKEEKQEE